MYTWMEAAIYCEGTFGVYTSMKEGYFICPACGDVINFDSSIDPENLRCPNCGEKFECIVEEDDLKALDGAEE